MIAFSSWILITGLATILSLGSQALASFTLIYIAGGPAPVRVATVGMGGVTVTVSATL